MSVEILPLDFPAPGPRRERRHPRLRLPIEVRIGGRAYRTADWSVAGLGFLGVDFDVRPGAAIEIELAVPLRDCNLGATFRATVRYQDRFRRRIGLEFLDTSPRQLAMLRFVADEHLEGQMLGLDGVLDFVARHADRAAAPSSQTAEDGQARHVAVRVLEFGLALLLGCGAGTLLAAAF